MKSHWIKILCCCIAALFLTACSQLLDSQVEGSTYPSQFIVGDVYILKSNEQINGNIAGIGTMLVIEEGAVVSGDVSLIGSNLDLSGQVNGDLNLVAGTSIIADSAVIMGDINQTYHQIQVSPNAQIRGLTNTFVFPSRSGTSSLFSISDLFKWVRPSRIAAIQAIRITFWVIIAVLILGLFPDPTSRVIAAIRSNLIPAIGVGIISLFIFPVVALILIITICLSPIGIILLFAIAISYIWGWITISFMLGIQLTSWLNLDWKKEAVAALGAFCLGLLTTLLVFIPLMSIIINVAISSVGIGGVIFSRFGTFNQEQQ